MVDSARALTLLEVFPPGRCRRIFKYLAEHREELDDTRRHGELRFYLGGNERSGGSVATSGPMWKPEQIEL